MLNKPHPQLKISILAPASQLRGKELKKSGDFNYHYILPNQKNMVNIVVSHFSIKVVFK